MYTLEQLQNKSLKELKEIGWELNALPAGDRRRRKSWIDALVNINPPLLQLLEASPAEDDVQAQEPPIESKFGRIVYPRPAQGAIVLAVENSHGVNFDAEEFRQAHASEIESYFKSFEADRPPNGGDNGRDRLENEPKMSQSAIVPATKKLPGSRSKASTAHQLLELFKSSAHILEDSPGVKTATAIVPAAKNRTEEGSDQNPILTGIPLSDRFVTRYTPPQPEIIHFQSDADGQLSLLDFEVESVDEPPDPDDFESLDAFCEALARWDAEHNEASSVHCESSSVHYESSSVHLEPPDPQYFDSMFAFWAAYDAWDKATDDDGEPSSIYKPLEISLDSFIEWAPCPPDWYEPAFLLEPSKVMEHLRADDSSNTSDFFIPTFGRWGDRANRTDEPPDTGIFARLPGPKPPQFPPRAIGYTASRNYSETIPKLFSVAAGSSTQPARSPPGGDAMS